MDWTIDALMAHADRHLKEAIPTDRFECDDKLRRLVVLTMASFACETMARHLRDSLAESKAA